jgi:phosphoglycolate phosphatase-like HAD superfamily hydrolase
MLSGRRNDFRGRTLEGIVHLTPHPEVKQALGVLKNAGLPMVTLTTKSSQKAAEQRVHIQA